MERTHDTVILAAGDYPTHTIACQILTQASHIVCCDGAAQILLSHGITPHAIVGDGDSLPPAIRKQYPHLIHTVSEQEDNDLTKATRFVMENIRPAHGLIAYLGCTGCREDHTLGNIALMARYHRDFHLQPTMYTDHGLFTPAIGTHTFTSFPGQQVSIFRLSGTHLSSTGLKWNAYPYAELWQGTLNEALAHTFTLHSDGQYIVFQTYEAKTPPPSEE